MNENNKMTSIARKINMDFWLKQLANIILINTVIAIAVIVVFFVEKDLDAFNLNVLKDVWKLIKVPALVLLVIEAAVLVGELFNTKNVRQRMKALNDIAIKAEELSKLNYSDEQVETLEQSISRFDPHMPGAKVKTGDKELQSLEIAINNMLERMRDSHRQQERFVSDASHELRTPISVIQGYVNMLDRWGKQDERILDESIEAIKNESEHMKNLIEQLLFLARGDGGRHSLKFEDFNMTELVKDVFEESTMIDDKHQYRLREDGPVEAKGDMAMIKQSLRILVQNAAKYSPENAVIELGSRIIDERASYTVQDEGIGMEDSDVIHVFERFYRSDRARNSAEGGTGLGLSIAKWVVDAHGGTIEVLSRPEFGTRFTVKL